MAARLKTFITSDGLTDFVVAATSRPKALEAWGVHQDLFKDGRAREVDDPDLVKAAAAQPGEVIERPTEGRAKLVKMRPAAKPKVRGPSKATLKKVADAEAEVARLREAREGEEAALDQERQGIEDRAAKMQARFETRLADLEEKLAKAKAAL